MTEYRFSHDNYRKMCELIKAEGTLCDYKDVLDKKLEKFIILRHDVEFSPERAYNLAKVESEADVSSTYFFQVTNNAYNIISKRNMEYLREILEMGHHVGLHFHLNGMTDLEQIQERILYEAKLLSYYLGIEVDRFSFHRPSELVLKNATFFKGLINAYAPEFFTYYSPEDEAPKVAVKYIADSKNEWQYTAPYTYPSEEFFKEYDKIQILCHPYSWTPVGYDTLGNLRSLIDEKRVEFIDTLNSETKYVRRYLDEL